MTIQRDRSRSLRQKEERASRPFVLVNMAMTADGKIATSNRTVSSFGSKHDRKHLLELRATADAVMAGARTVDLNAVNLGPGPRRFRELRIRRGLDEYNLRVVVSGSGTIDPDAEIFKKRFSPIIILTTGRAPKSVLAKLRTLADEVKICGARQLDFVSAFEWLHREWNVKRLLCEGGGELNDALLLAGLVDELHVTICPFIFGGRDAPTIADGQGVPSLSAAHQFDGYSSKRIGDELYLRLKRRLAAP